MLKRTLLNTQLMLIRERDSWAVFTSFKASFKVVTAIAATDDLLSSFANPKASFSSCDVVEEGK